MARDSLWCAKESKTSSTLIERNNIPTQNDIVLNQHTMTNYASGPVYKHITVQHVGKGLVEVQLNRPEKKNAINTRMWQEIGQCFSEELANDSTCRCVLLTGAGTVFSSGIDFGSLSLISGTNEGGAKKTTDVAHHALRILREGGAWQQAWKSINQCGKPVIACIHGGCYGAALELVAFADIRFCTKDTVFKAPEVDVGLAADIGGNQVLPKVIGNDSLLRELMLTGRAMGAAEAMEFGLVSHVANDHSALMTHARQIGRLIAQKSPVATHGVKTVLNYTRDHSVDDSLAFALTWNAAMVQSNDTLLAGMAFVTKQAPVFAALPPLTISKL